MTKLTLPILESGYSFSEANHVSRTQTKGGFSRFQSDLDDASLFVSVTWKCSEADYNTLIAFFQTTTKEGSLPFSLDLVIDSGDLVEHDAYFSSAGPQLKQVVGLNYFVTDTLEVTPKPVDEAFDESIIAVYAGAGGSNVPDYLDKFNIIVNANWPEA